jgi:ribonucleoside-diphosphate reductase alpha chain
LRTENGKGIKLAAPTEIIFTGEKEVFELKTKKGLRIKVTPNHKILTKAGWKSASEISSDDTIFIYNGNIDFTENKNDIELGEILGWLVGNGWLSEGQNARVGFTFGGSDKEIMEYLTPKINKLYHLNSEIKPLKRESNVYHLSYHSPKFVETFKELGVKVCKADTKEVPSSILFGDMSLAKGFLKGIFSADGYVNFVKDKSAEIRLTSKSRILLEQTQLLLLKFNICSKIYNRSRPARKAFSYITITGREKIYETDGILYELVISKRSVLTYLEQVGFLCNKNEKKINLLKLKNYYSENFTDKIISMKKLGMEKVYDIKNIETHSFISNGFVVHNCGEQPLLPNEACNLGSINLSLMVAKGSTPASAGAGGKDGTVNWNLLKETIYTATDFLDDVINCSAFPLPDIKKMAKANRKIGLGVMGWADMLVQLGIPYNSDKAINLAKEVMEFIDYHSKIESMRLAKERGPFPNFKGSIYSNGKLIRSKTKFDWDRLKQEIAKNGIRNATTTTIAPTGTISMIADSSSGIEPLFSLVYVKNVMDGKKLVYVNKYFEKVAKEQGFYSKKLMEKISEKGSLQDIKEVPKHIKKVFVTAHDISPEWHIKMQSAFQCYVDNAVSKTINFPNEARKEDIKAAYELAYQLSCKGITVYRDGSREEQVLNIGKKMREQEKSRIAPRRRPATTVGVTKRIDTGCGHLYVTINTDENGICEVFTQMGKAGGCASAQLEAIARLISLALRSNVKVESIIKQLRSIRCPSPMWSKGKMILSCADGIANALEEFIAKDENDLRQKLHNAVPIQNKDASENSDSPFTGLGAICPECGAALEFKEGCKTCPICGWSKCS